MKTEDEIIQKMHAIELRMLDEDGDLLRESAVQIKTLVWVLTGEKFVNADLHSR